MPSPCASSRAPRTACAEQQLSSPSFSGSDHSSSVTADGLARPRARTSSAATALSTPPLIATSVRSRDGRERRARARRSPERAVQRVGGELGRVALGGAQPAELLRDLLGADARRVAAAGAPRTRPTTALPAAIARAAAARVEARVGDPPVGAVGIERERDADQIAAGRAARRAGEGVRGVLPARRAVASRC